MKTQPFKPLILAALVALLALLAACSSAQTPTSTDPSPTPELNLLALPGAPGNSSSLRHLYPPDPFGNGHNGTVVGKRTSGSDLPADSYIPRSATFQVNLGADHIRSNIQAYVTPEYINDTVLCSWQTNSYRVLRCARAFTLLPSNVTFTVTVREYDPSTLTWKTVNTSYFRTTTSIN